MATTTHQVITGHGALELLRAVADVFVELSDAQDVEWEAA